MTLQNKQMFVFSRDDCFTKGEDIMNYKTKKSLVMVGILIVFSLTLLKFIQGTTVSASSDLRVNERKYFTSYVVGKGDSLWTIADNYITKEYASIQDYIDEVIESNHLSVTASIYPGQLLVLPYYADEPIVTADNSLQ